MAMYEIPRNTKGEGRILYIFSTKALIYTVAGMLLGFGFKWLLGLIGKNVTIGVANVLNGIGVFFIIFLGALGFILGTFKVPQIDKFEITRKAAGVNLDTVVKEYIKFSLKKDKYYTYDTSDLIRQELEYKEKEEQKEREEKERRERAK